MEKIRLTIRDVPKTVLEKLDEIVENEKYPSRNQLIIEILERYSMVRNEIYFQSIPPIIHSICKAEIEAEIEDITAFSKATAQTVALAAARLLKVAQRLDECLIDDEQAQAEYKAIDEIAHRMGNSE